MDPTFTEIVKQLGSGGIFFFLLWKLWQRYTADMDKLMSRYDETVKENTKVITLAVTTLERLADNGHDAKRA